MWRVTNGRGFIYLLVPFHDASRSFQYFSFCHVLSARFYEGGDQLNDIANFNEYSSFPSTQFIVGIQISSQLSLKSMSSSGSLRLDICTPRYFLLFLSFHLLAIDGCLSVQHSLSSCLEAFSISLRPATPWRYRNFRWILTHLSTDHAHPSLSFTGGKAVQIPFLCGRFYNSCCTSLDLRYFVCTHLRRVGSLRNNSTVNEAISIRTIILISLECSSCHKKDVSGTFPLILVYGSCPRWCRRQTPIWCRKSTSTTFFTYFSLLSVFFQLYLISQRLGHYLRF